jgi:hypothetical protein
VNFPKSKKTRAALAVGIAATSVVMIVGPGSTAATAGRLIGSAAIKNNTIRSLDIRNETITGRDVKDGSLTAKDFSGTLRGATGPRGPAGPTGDSGDSAATTSNWTFHSDGSSQFVILTSTDTVPAGTQVVPVKLTVAGDFQGCPVANATVQLGGLDLARTTRSNGAWVPSDISGGGYIAGSAKPLRFVLSCSDNNFRQVPVPVFDATVKVTETPRDIAATSTHH